MQRAASLPSCEAAFAFNKPKYEQKLGTLVYSTSTGVKGASPGLLLLQFSLSQSLWLVKILPSFARRDPGILLVHATAGTALALLPLSHPFQSGFFLLCLVKMHSSKVKFRGCVLRI